MFYISWDELIDHAKSSGGIPYLKKSIERYQETLKRYRADYKERKSPTTKECIEIALEDIAREKQLIRILRAEIAREKQQAAAERKTAKKTWVNPAIRINKFGKGK